MHPCAPPLLWLTALGALLAAPAAARGLPGPEPLTVEAPPAPFAPRRRTIAKELRARQRGLVELDRWPEEPDTPVDVSPEQFSAAFLELCHGSAPTAHLRRYAEWILASAEDFQVDPFLTAAVIYRFSRCRQADEASFGIGLGRIDPRMHQAHIQGDHYHYHVLRDGAWHPARLPLPRHRFTLQSLRRAEPNLYFTAALLAVARAQCPHNDGVFGSVPHRHFVSHYAWGDQVEGAGAEDRVLRARRRLIELYRGQRPGALTDYQGLPLHSPLDGAPRKITSALGADRDGGRRRHRGVDFDSTTGEPVRAIADGVVTFAGADMRRGKSQRLPASAARRIASRRLGAGGLMVMIQHDQGLQSAYMHLSDYSVQTGDVVQGGQPIGRVGRSGIKRSSAHLHFEIRQDGKHIDPIPLLRPYVFTPQETWWGRRVAIYERDRRRQRRRTGRQAQATQRAARRGSNTHQPGHAAGP